MLWSWRMRICEAEEALEAGRLDEARRLVCQGDLREFLPGKRLADRIAAELAGRARQRLLAGEAKDGWRDLGNALRLSDQASVVVTARQELVAQLLATAEADIAAGEPAQAVARLEGLERTQIANEPLEKLVEVARRAASAHNLSQRGKFAEAEAQWAVAATLRPEWSVIRQLRAACQARMRQCQELSEELHRAVRGEQWTEALVLADRLLAIAPQSPLGHDARRRAWLAVGAGTEGQMGSGVVFGPRRNQRLGGLAEDDSRPRHALAPESRFLLWIDGVGGYLVCLNDEIVLGRAGGKGAGARRAPASPPADSVPPRAADVPLLADLSQLHARIRRADGYVLEPIGEVTVDGKPLRGPRRLADGDEIVLGGVVRLRFRQPHALSGTARLEFLSPHRPEPSVDGVVLMAESCVLGPQWRNHVVCRGWSRDAVLFRRDGQLYCRSVEALEIDDAYCPGEGQVELDSHIVGHDFSMTLEPYPAVV